MEKHITFLSLFFLSFLKGQSISSLSELSENFSVNTDKVPVKEKVLTQEQALFRYASPGSPISRLNLKDLHYVQKITCAGGGVDIVQDSQGQKYTLKFNNDKESWISSIPILRYFTRFSKKLAREIVADAVYKSIGLCVPDFVVYQELPKELRDIKELKNKKGMVRIAQFISSRAIPLHQKKEILQKKLQENFAVFLTFMSGDLHPGNFIIDEKQEEPWFIDNNWFLKASFFLRYDNLFPDIEKDIQRLKHENDIFENLELPEIKRQVRDLLKKEKKIMAMFEKVSRKVDLPNRFSYLLRLKKRFKALHRFVEDSEKT